MSDRDELLAKLNAGRDELLAAVDGMTDEQAAAKPRPAAGRRWNAWSTSRPWKTLMLRRLTSAIRGACAAKS